MSVVAPKPETAESFGLAKELETKIEALKKSLSKTSGAIPVISYGETDVTGNIVTVRFPKKFSKRPVVIAFYSIPGAKVSVSPVSFPGIPSLKLPRIIVKAPRIAPISFTPKLPSISVPTPPRLTLSLISQVPKVTVNIPRLPKIRGISLEDIKKAIPSFSVRIPKVSKPNFASLMATKMRDMTKRKFKGYLGDWGWANWIRDSIIKAVSSMAYWWGYIVGIGLGLFYDYVLAPQIDNVTKQLNYAISQTFSKIHSGLNRELNEIVKRFNQIVDKLNTNFSTMRNSISEAINDSVNSAVGNVNRSIREINDRLNTLSKTAYAYAQFLSGSINNQFSAYNESVVGAFKLYAEKMNVALADLSDKVTKAINTGLDSVRTSFNASAKEFTSKVNATMRTFSGSLNRVIEALTVMTGFIDGKTYSVSEPTAVSTEGFSVKVAKPGGKLFWVAIQVS